jgi:hypothetical protein
MGEPGVFSKKCVAKALAGRYDRDKKGTRFGGSVPKMVCETTL